MDNLLEPARQLRRVLDRHADLIVDGSNGTSIVLPAGERAKALASDIDLIRDLYVAADSLAEALQVLPADAPGHVSDIAERHRIPVDAVMQSPFPILAIWLGAARAHKALAFPPMHVIFSESSLSLTRMGRSIGNARQLADAIAEARDRLLDAGEIEMLDGGDDIPF